MTGHALSTPTWRQRLRSRQLHHVGGRALDDDGMTLVELLVASMLLVVLLTAVMITMNLLNGISVSVSAQYAEYDQIVPALAPLQTLLRAEIEPAAPSNGLPSPSFTSVGNFSMTFYAAVGTINNNITSAGVSAGPVRVTAGEYDSTGAPVSTVAPASSCTVAAPCSFQVREFFPIVTAGAAAVGTTCASFTLACAYPSTYKLVANVSGVVNSPNQAFTTLNPAIFTYGVSDTEGGTPYVLTTTQVQAGLQCALPNSGVGCPADYIQSVGINLVVAKPGASAAGAGTNGYVQNQTIVYRNPQSPGATTYPFQYTGTWG